MQAADGLIRHASCFRNSRAGRIPPLLQALDDMAPVSRVREEIFPHEHLWRSGKLLLVLAKDEGQENYKLLLPALLISYTAYEAFINFCGHVLAPELWKEESKNFRGKGIEEKINVICQRVPDFAWLKGERPYQTIRSLRGFRDTISHPQVVAAEYETERQKDGSHIRYEAPWDEYMSVDSIRRIRGDIEAFCESLRQSMSKVVDHPHVIASPAFKGTLAQSEGESYGV